MLRSLVSRLSGPSAVSTPHAPPPPLTLNACRQFFMFHHAMASTLPAAGPLATSMKKTKRLTPARALRRNKTPQGIALRRKPILPHLSSKIGTSTTVFSLIESPLLHVPLPSLLDLYIACGSCLHVYTACFGKQNLNELILIQHDLPSRYHTHCRQKYAVG